MKIGLIAGSTDVILAMIPLPHRRNGMFYVQRWFILVIARSFL